ncbi:unnamed protein product [Didymodactylos carnosus]|uniref:Uncharacterized protein n=1 Tax=Didymodactylos carnosus TaxID=1234261 RepID=A0A814HXS5_9BILA|nr:unnamed protein product [Didymodactylos carnosus]CAF1016813.1 unnamed protein product [Didymodactylos carnosus]CAF3667601.1 unnamed protein product [Didymodactylos carnosus]CAF3788346.1 unnamed protein product [Didymodactylos carnosus]
MVTATVQLLDITFALDKEFGLETAAVIWGTPAQYIHPDCLGGKIGSAWTYVACPPMYEFMPAYYDWIAFAASRWTNIVHWIIGNEVDQSPYYDPTPYSNNVNHSIVNTSDGHAWVARYVNLFTTAHQTLALVRQGVPTMMYVSVDRQWKLALSFCPTNSNTRCALGTFYLLEGLWASVATSFDWSVAVHAYGVVNESDWHLTSPYQAYTFLDLPYVLAYQQSKLANDSTVINKTLAPQAFIAATEQAWNSGLPSDANTTAYYICIAHNVSVNNFGIIFATHLDYQEIVNPAANQHGIIPLAAGTFLNGSGVNSITMLATILWGAGTPAQTARTQVPSSTSVRRLEQQQHQRRRELLVTLQAQAAQTDLQTYRPPIVHRETARRQQSALVD